MITPWFKDAVYEKFLQLWGRGTHQVLWQFVGKIFSSIYFVYLFSSRDQVQMGINVVDQATQTSLDFVVHLSLLLVSLTNFLPVYTYWTTYFPVSSSSNLYSAVANHPFRLSRLRATHMLAEINLVRPNHFGLHVIVYCSCNLWGRALNMFSISCIYAHRRAGSFPLKRWNWQPSFG